MPPEAFRVPSDLPYRQLIGRHAGPPLEALVEQLAPVLEHYRTAPPPEAQAIFENAHREDDLPDIRRLANGWKEKADALVVAGAGGSGLSGKALAMLRCGLHCQATAPKLYVLDNLDGFTLPSLLKHLAPTRTAFLFISKSGSTLETCALALILLEYLKTAGVRDIAARTAVITRPGESPLRSLAAQHALPVLDHDPRLSGRFSLLSVVGLISAAFMDIDIDALRAGARHALAAGLHASPAHSPAALGAALQVAMLREGRNINLLMPYSEQLWGLALWWRQSWAESLGKNGQGSTPVVAIGTADQHSQLQLFLDGPDDKLFTLLLSRCAGQGMTLPSVEGPLSYLGGYTLGDLVAAQQHATAETLERYGRPVRIFEADTADAYTLGALIMHFTLEIIYAAALLGCRPFEQPAVEESKRLAHIYLTGSRT